MWVLLSSCREGLALSLQAGSVILWSLVEGLASLGFAPSAGCGSQSQSWLKAPSPGCRWEPLVLTSPSDSVGWLSLSACTLAGAEIPGRAFQLTELGSLLAETPGALSPQPRPLGPLAPLPGAACAEEHPWEKLGRGGPCRSYSASKGGVPLFLPVCGCSLLCSDGCCLCFVQSCLLLLAKGLVGTNYSAITGTPMSRSISTLQMK